MINTATSLCASGRLTYFLQEAQCGKLGFTIITVNTIAISLFAANLALTGMLTAPISLTAAAIILPSMALFGPSNYFYYLPQPLRMGLGFAAAWATVRVNSNGAWEGSFADWAHFNDYRLAMGLENFFKENQIQTAMDCGCGTGFYVNRLRANGLNEIYGCDGNPATSELAGEHCIVADLTQENFLKVTEHEQRQFDCVFSLEVAEHLPAEYEEVFLNNLISIANPRGWIVLSWAKRGQGGLGHVNEQNEEYVLERMKEKGWILDPQKSHDLRLQTAPNTFWFRDTIYVFQQAVAS